MGGLGPTGEAADAPRPPPHFVSSGLGFQQKPLAGLQFCCLVPITSGDGVPHTYQYRPQDRPHGAPSTRQRCGLSSPKTTTCPFAPLPNGWPHRQATTP